MNTSTIDYDALAQQHGGAGAIDYDALASQHGGKTAPSPKLGALSRFGTSGREALGVPELGDHPIEDLKRDVNFAKDNPGQAAKQLAMSPIEGYKAAVTAQQKRMSDAFKRGDYTEAAIHGLYYLLSPVGGANLGKAGEQLKSGDIAGAAGTTAGTALPLSLGSPEVRANVGAATNAARGAVATGLEKSAGPMSTLATIAGAGHELLQGRPYNAAVAAALGKPSIAKTMKLMAQGIRPDEPGMIPLGPISKSAQAAAQRFLQSQGIEGDVAANETEAAARQMQANPAEASPAQLGMARGPQPINGETALRQILTGQDNANLMRLAKSRGINVTQEAQLRPGKADNLLINKIVNDFKPEELDEVGARFQESTRFRHNFGDIGPEAWKTMGMQTYFPEVKIPAAVAKRTAGAIAAQSTETPQFAYRVRDAGETGIMPKGHAQATLDQTQAQSYIEGRGAAQGAPQEVVKVDLSKLDPKDYTMKTGPGGKQWVQFKKPVPESFIEKMKPEPTTEWNADTMKRNLEYLKRLRGAKAGD